MVVLIVFVAATHYSYYSLDQRLLVDHDAFHLGSWGCYFHAPSLTDHPREFLSTYAGCTHVSEYKLVPVLLDLLGRAFRYSANLYRVVQLAFACLFLLGVFAVTHRISSKRTAVVVTYLVAGVFIFDNLGRKYFLHFQSSAVLLWAYALAFSERTQSHPQEGAFGAGGIAGVAALIHPTALVQSVPLVLWPLVSPRKVRTGAGSRIAALVSTVVALGIFSSPLFLSFREYVALKPGILDRSAWVTVLNGRFWVNSATHFGRDQLGGMPTLAIGAFIVVAFILRIRHGQGSKALQTVRLFVGVTAAYFLLLQVRWMAGGYFGTETPLLIPFLLFWVATLYGKSTEATERSQGAEVAAFFLLCGVAAMVAATTRSDYPVLPGSTITVTHAMDRRVIDVRPNVATTAIKLFDDAGIDANSAIDVRVDRCSASPVGCRQVKSIDDGGLFGLYLFTTAILSGHNFRNAAAIGTEGRASVRGVRVDSENPASDSELVRCLRSLRSQGPAPEHARVHLQTHATECAPMDNENLLLYVRSTGN